MWQKSNCLSHHHCRYLHQHLNYKAICQLLIIFFNFQDCQTILETFPLSFLVLVIFSSLLFSESIELKLHPFCWKPLDPLIFYIFLKFSVLFYHSDFLPSAECFTCSFLSSSVWWLNWDKEFFGFFFFYFVFNVSIYCYHFSSLLCFCCGQQSLIYFHLSPSVFSFLCGLFFHTLIAWVFLYFCIFYSFASLLSIYLILSLGKIYCTISIFSLFFFFETFFVVPQVVWPWDSTICRWEDSTHSSC